jgi:hypothetical protein
MSFFFLQDVFSTLWAVLVAMMLRAGISPVDSQNLVAFYLHLATQQVSAL